MLSVAVETQQPMRSEKASLLFVDDEPRVLTSMRAMFRRSYRVFLANSGAEALDILGEESIDVVVSDQRMPEMTGVEVLARVKEIAPTTMRILLTGYADLEAIEASINEGEVFRYLMKPCPPTELKETVSMAVQAVRATEEALHPAVEEIGEGSAANDEDLPLLEVNVVPFAAVGEEPGTEIVGNEDYPDVPVVGRQFTDGNVPANSAHPPAEEDVLPISIAPADVEILVLTTDPELMAGIEEAVGHEHAVRFASQRDSALTMLSQHPIGVLVTDASVNEEEVKVLTKQLKQQVPELVTILVSDRSDASMLIDLINHGQVFRFLLKPIQPGQSRIWLNSAVSKYIELMSHESVSSRYRVKPIAEALADTRLVSGLLEGIARIKTRLSQWKRFV